MQDRITPNVRRAARWTLLPAVATAALLAVLPSALAADQQATPAEMDNAQNWEDAATAGPRAQSFRTPQADAPAIDDRQADPAEMDDEQNWDDVGGRAKFHREEQERERNR
jgi:hypothetical protein